jgi:hypothetical protein
MTSRDLLVDMAASSLKIGNYNSNMQEKLK